MVVFRCAGEGEVSGVERGEGKERGDGRGTFDGGVGDGRHGEGAYVSGEVGMIGRAWSWSLEMLLSKL